MSDESLEETFDTALADIEDLMSALNKAEDEEAREAAEREIQERPLEIKVRSDWLSPGEEPGPMADYLILLTTGGPAVRVTGELDQYGSPGDAALEVQDWGTPFTTYPTTLAAAETLIHFAQQFYFGEG